MRWRRPGMLRLVQPLGQRNRRAVQQKASTLCYGRGETVAGVSGWDVCADTCGYELYITALQNA